MDRLDEFAVFAKVVETGSFTAAARALGISKAKASKQVARLEGRLGARLLNRTTRRLSVTEAGGAFHERCRRILAEVEEAEDAVGRLQAAPRGILRINAPMTFGLMHLSPLVPAYMARYPEVTVDLSLNDRFVDLVEEGWDLAVRIGRLRDSSLIARRLASFRAVVCAAPAYWERRGRPEHPRDLGGHDCLIYSYLERPEDWRFARDGEEASVRVAGPLRANNGQILLEAAVAGAGVLLSPTFIVADALADGRLEAVLSPWCTEDVGIHAVYPHARHLSAKVRTFVDFLAAELGNRNDWASPALHPGR